MLIKTLQETNPFDGTTTDSKFYFDLNEAELVRIIVNFGGSKVEDLPDIVQGFVNNDPKRLLEMYEEIILTSVGERKITENGAERFVKSRDYKEYFAASTAYGKLFIEVMSDPDAAQKFIEGVTSHITKANNGGLCGS